MSEHWEYVVELFVADSRQLQANLNAVAKHGWRLHSIIHHGLQYVATFERRVPDER